MSTVCGIIAECNPLHDGHRHLISEAARITGADFIVIVLSGDFTQRGIPAVYDKYSRTEALLASGADLVIELPCVYATAGAGHFAAGGIRLLDSLGAVTDIAFGSECADPGRLLALSGRLNMEESSTFKEALRSGLRGGKSYPAAMESALGGDSGYPSTPNDILAVEYLRTLSASGSSIRPVIIPRIDAPHASELRAALLSSGASDPCPIGIDDFSPMLFGRLRGLYPFFPDGKEAAVLSLSQYADVTKDIASRLISRLNSVNTITGLTMALKTKNLTYTRVSRALIHILLEIRRDMLTDSRTDPGPGYARILGMGSRAGALLSLLGRTSRIPLIVRPASDRRLLDARSLSHFEADLRASLIYETASSARNGLSSSGVVTDLQRKVIRKLKP